MYMLIYLYGIICSKHANDIGHTYLESYTYY